MLRALGRSGDHSIASTVFAELEGPDGDPAAYALGQLNDDSAYPRVIQLARNQRIAVPDLGQ